MQNTPGETSGTGDEVCWPPFTTWPGVTEKVAPATGWPVSASTLLITIRPQLVMCTGAGAMKSFSSDVNESEARLLTYDCEKLSHARLLKIPAAFRSIPSSPNSRLSAIEATAWLELRLVRAHHDPDVALPFHVAMWIETS